MSDKRFELCFEIKRSRSLSNAVRFKRDNNVCACAVSVLILLPIVTENGFSDIDFLHDANISLVNQR